MAETPDPIEVVREARHRISERFDHDPAKIVQYYSMLQREFRGRLLEGLPKVTRASQHDDATDDDSRRQ